MILLLHNLLFRELLTCTSFFSYPESQGDALLVEVQDINTVKQGHAIIQMSSLIDSHVCICSLIFDWPSPDLGFLLTSPDLSVVI